MLTPSVEDRSSVFSRLPTHLRRALMMSQIMVLVWWEAALAIRQANIGIPVWYDQSITFSNTTNLLNPYRVNLVCCI